MKQTGMAAGLVMALAAFLLSACATNAGLATADEPHAILQELLAGDIDDTHFKARLVRVDGQSIRPGNRRTYVLEPGRHTLGFELDVESLQRYESAHGGNFPDPSAASASVNEKSLDVTLEAGESYKFGVIIEDYNYAGWTPFVVEADAAR